ncbi:MAG: hypothetical protein V5A55_00525 [Halovenus sp.]
MEQPTVPSPTRHDVSLVFIGLVFLIGAAVAFSSSVGVPTALAGASVLASGSVGYALFYSPPGR